ncbi:ABC transporter substrate-binding protein [Bifidobacterium aemilianum]|uniref:ABC transporter substrate-binding protein n=1 Tax=Bifidobacterium aemilianum TaxID=2493120 RepID=A0A366KAW2_9BIFI|nr:ABC transporter substrate-binding protein [Bifidobacterium aemilianum]RBP98253.1 ABC transporter substrate-binding protein [Bifidobacterium aemilianum]
MVRGRHIRSLLAASCALTMALAVGACGTSDDKDGSAQMGYDVSSIKKDPALAALLPESVTRDGKFTVGAATEYAPAEFLASDGKTPIGYEVDLSKALAALFGLEEETVSTPFDSVIPAIGSKYDVGISGFTVTAERMDAVEFVSYFKAGSTYVVRKGNPDRVDISNLCGRTVGLQTGTVQETEMIAADSKCRAEGKKSIDIQSLKMQTDVTTSVVTGKADVFYSDSPVAGYAVKQTDGALQTLGRNVGVTPAAAAIKKGDRQTTEAIRQGFQKLMDDGTYMKILDTWGVGSGAISKAEINPEVK